ncbi:RloB family protein [Streptomyces sp. enrichment culture]|uniref:RloB family protein n=1 Tax=Streptomyces sp. enrichment culture TaxID=1795815 RepID=UPI003F54D62B
MSRGQQNRNQQGNRRRRRRDWEATPSVRRPAQSYGDESRRVVYVAAEGERTERDYIALLNAAYGEREKFYLNFAVTRKGLRPTEVVDLVLASASAPEDEKWALFDRDALDNRDQDIPDAMREAARQGVQVGLSHPSFELWLLLHFQQFTSQEEGISDTVVQRLRAHREAKGFENYDTGSGNQGKGINEEQGRTLTDPDKHREQTAVRNARKLVGQCPHGDCSGRNIDHSAIPGPRTETYEQWTRRSGHAENCDPLKRDPSSDVWRLLVRLGIVEDETRGA